MRTAVYSQNNIIIKTLMKSPQSLHIFFEYKGFDNYSLKQTLIIKLTTITKLDLSEQTI